MLLIIDMPVDVLDGWPATERGAGRGDAFRESTQACTKALEILSNAETLFSRGAAKLKTRDKAAADADIVAAKARDPLITERFARFGVSLQ